MVIVEEKCMQSVPPPPYFPNASTLPPPPFPGEHRGAAKPSDLPPHLLLKIVYMTFPQTPGVDEGKIERQRKTLCWLSTQLRSVNRSFYIACEHVLRSTYLPAYNSMIRPPYSSDPFPFSSSASTSSCDTLQRETKVLDLFIALKVHEDVMVDDSSLHLEREDSFKDLFDLMQPRSRLEDLVRHYGVREGVVHTNPHGVNASPSSSSMFRVNNSGIGSASTSKWTSDLAPVPFSALSISFSPRRVGLVLTASGRKRTIVDVARTRDEKLEVTAKKLVLQLKVWLSDGSR
ncbi:uncharacterized protein F5891DRAFT_1067875 [Suillus fuscotomentosus]|uniref:Uncharacterized protein n=1 Tax=Suillus fuscotomentosus TaxID=1912939 RepID=A0AAD4DTS1_9AGAM|nr:uncharacterized protein F5891DRAFT_1067875 [Suillus fuscotomentosus]KAG1893014.1 hypothetical protein F5891DRAFT_1067875 [Suillus fuscotomentosus]